MGTIDQNRSGGLQLELGNIRCSTCETPPPPVEPCEDWQGVSGRVSCSRSDQGSFPNSFRTTIITELGGAFTSEFADERCPFGHSCDRINEVHVLDHCDKPIQSGSTTPLCFWYSGQFGHCTHGDPLSPFPAVHDDDLFYWLFFSGNNNWTLRMIRSRVDALLLDTSPSFNLFGECKVTGLTMAQWRCFGGIPTKTGGGPGLGRGTPCNVEDVELLGFAWFLA